MPKKRMEANELTSDFERYSRFEKKETRPVK